MLVLGIDPGTAIMGYGIIDGAGNSLALVTYGALTTPADAPVEQRLRMLYDGLMELIEKYRPEAMAVEELFFARNVRSALTVGQARGVALLAAAQKKLPVWEYTPLEVKQAVAGYGRGKKEQIQTMVMMLLGLTVRPDPDDAADALAVAICHLNGANLRDMVASRLERAR